METYSSKTGKMSSRSTRHEEYRTSNVVRTLTRAHSPPQKNIEYNNNNLDNLLDDLQTTVSRTAEHLNSANATKSNDIQFLAPSNSTTIVEEHSSSPIGENRKLYKHSHYEYSSSNSARDGVYITQPKSYESVEPANVNQLDNLLNDLKQEREHPFDRDAGIDDGLLEPNARITQTTRSVISSNKTSSRSKPVNRELKFDSPSMISTVIEESRTRQRSRSPNYQHIDSQILRDVKYENDPVLDNTPNSTMNRSYNYSKTSSNTRNVNPYPNTEIVEMDTTDLPTELRDAPISSELLPGPGTKVTTTIKTYTYEIPNDTKVPTNKNFNYKNEFYNSLNSSSTYYPERDAPVPITTTNIYTNESHNSHTENIYPAASLGPNQKYFYKKETNETKNNIYGPPRSPLPGPVNTTAVYERNVSNTRNVYHPPGGVPVYPSNANLPPHQPGSKHSYLYKKETTNTTNAAFEPPNGREYLPHNRYMSEPREPTNNQYYKYSSQTTSTTNHGRPNEHEPLLTPFPLDGYQHHPTDEVDGPPKHLGQLMASFNEETGRIDDEPYVARKEVNTALATNKNIPIVEPKAPTKNIAGPPVYYPPGKELFAKSEAQAAWRAQGGYAKGSGKYEYEAESKSKSSSKSGAAVVPVCLPLCCAMPCTIM